MGWVGQEDGCCGQIGRYRILEFWIGHAMIEPPLLRKSDPGKDVIRRGGRLDMFSVCFTLLGKFKN
jgi:hypothetical protein